MRRRRLPARAVGGAWLQCCSARAEGLQRGGAAVEVALRRGDAPPARAKTTDDHARFLEAVVSTNSGALRVASIYLPNGNPPETRQIFLQDQLDGPAHSLCARASATGGTVGPGRGLQRHPERARCPPPGALGGRRPVPAAHPEEIPRALQSRADRRGPGRVARAGSVHLLGLSGRRLAEERRHPHRPPAAVTAGRRPADRSGHRQACARLGKAVGPRPGLGGSADAATEGSTAWLSA